MKNTVSKADQWNADLYDSNHSFVSQYGNSLLELLNPKPNEKILDLGCGTGDLAEQLFQKEANVIGIDKSPNMVAQAAKKYPHLNFSVQNATSLKFSNEFDAVFSNATLHWVKPPNIALTRIYESLKKGGRFVAEFGGKGNVQQITDGIINELKMEGFSFQEEQFPWYYPSIAEYTALMENTGFRVVLAQHYDRPTPLNGIDGLKNWINMFGDSFFINIKDDVKDRLITNVVNYLKESLFDEKTNNWIADYKRIRVIGIKE
ncbi:class I SAM-dependent methyltransferase [Niallia nealsonii]|uniref:SAM-dependent methyltransferase n=1 Tax=Niallia nealsonii TaxID=115979 RepID=A0A2N0Z5P9_9BACI|nr:class I SAM-dependent methyltransferase [Niallia nealsonii]PKG24829.1 SAM-dependent methyltransferase [Niallia nealsonii]